MKYVKFELIDEMNKVVILKIATITQIYEDLENKVTIVVDNKFHYKVKDKLEEVEKKLKLEMV